MEREKEAAIGEQPLHPYSHLHGARVASQRCPILQAGGRQDTSEGLIGQDKPLESRVKV